MCGTLWAASIQTVVCYFKLKCAGDKEQLKWEWNGTGKGAVYSYDPVGSYQRELFKCGGSASHLIQSFLDNQVDFKHMTGTKPRMLTKEEALRVAKDAFTGAAERDIYTGDSLEIHIVDKDGVKTELYELRKD